MSSRNDEMLQARALAALDRARLPLAVEVERGRARVTGVVSSPEEYQAAIDVVKSIEGISKVEDEIEIQATAPDSAFDDLTDQDGYEYVENPAAFEADELEIEADFNEEPDVGADDAIESVEEAEPYFPPTDPVVTPSDDDQELEITGGFQDTSMDELAEEPELDSPETAPTSPLSGDRDDETIQEDVVRALKTDALTTDLDLEIDVRRAIVRLRGNVQALNDALNAEEVTRRVPGVRDVYDETTISQ